MASQLCRGPHCSPGERLRSLGHTRISGEALVTHSCRKIICMLYKADAAAVFPASHQTHQRGLRWERKFQSVLRRRQAGRRTHTSGWPHKAMEKTPASSPVSVSTVAGPRLLLCEGERWAWASEFLEPSSSLPLTDEKCLPPPFLPSPHSMASPGVSSFAPKGTKPS